MQYRATQFEMTMELAGSADGHLTRMLRRVAKDVDAGVLTGTLTDAAGLPVGQWSIAVERVDAQPQPARTKLNAVAGGE